MFFSLRASDDYLRPLTYQRLTKIKLLNSCIQYDYPISSPPAPPAPPAYQND